MAACKHCGGTGEEPDQKSLCAEMRERRKALGFTLAGLSRELGISPQYLHDMEKGRRPWNSERVKTILALPHKRKAK